MNNNDLLAENNELKEKYIGMLEENIRLKKLLGEDIVDIARGAPVSLKISYS